MPDDILRTRIAAVQQAHHLRMDPNHPAWGYCRCGLNVGFQDRADEPVPEFEWWVIHARHVADAVIRELDLGTPCASQSCRMHQIAPHGSQKPN